MTNSRLRRLTVEGVLLALVAMLAVLGLQRAEAVTAGGFEIDGNIAASSDQDWSNVGGQPVAVDGVNNPDSSIFFGGSKENNPSGWKVHGSGQPPNKDDIGYVFAYAHRTAGHEWFDVGFERVGDNGTTHFTLELNQKANTTNRTARARCPPATSPRLRWTLRVSTTCRSSQRSRKPAETARSTR